MFGNHWEPHMLQPDHDINVQSGASNPEMSNNNNVQVPLKKHPNVQTKMSKTKVSKTKMSKTKMSKIKMKISKMSEISKKNHPIT